MKPILLIAGGIGAGALIYFFKQSQANQELDSVGRSSNGLNLSAIHVNWDKVPSFSPGEFQDQLHLLDANVVYVLQKLRNKIGRIKISPAPGAIARTDGSTSTMHYADLTLNQLSLAIDIMPLDVDLKTAYQAARELPEIGGLGVYPDWLPLPGLHIDLRNRKPGGGLAEWSGLKVAGGQKYGAVAEAFA